MKVMLLNPPFSRKIIRGNYCSSEPKASYLYPPADLVMISGILDRYHELDVIDAVAEEKTEEEVLLHISIVNPDAVIFVTSVITYESDCRFLQLLKGRYENAMLIGSGDIFLSNPKAALQRNAWLDAVITDFTSPDILRYLSGDSSNIKYVVAETTGELSRSRIKVFGDPANKREFQIGIPRHDLFPTQKYQLSHGIRTPATLTMLSFGCPFTCSYCPMERILYKYRSINDALLEMRRISNWGIREVFFLDQTFGVRIKETLRFCRLLADEKLDLTWACLCRADLITEELVVAMKHAGCHTIQFGVETSNESTLIAMEKKIPLETTKNAFRLCKKYGIRTAAHFILGLPGDDKESAESSVDLAIALDCDFAAFNIVESLVGTTFQEVSIREGWIAEGQLQTHPYPQTGDASFSEVVEWRRQAVRRFYFRPKYLIKMLKGIRSWHHLKSVAINGLYIFRQYVFS